MRITSFLAFSFIGALTVSAIPDVLYRGSKVKPKAAKEAGGLKAVGYSNPYWVDDDHQKTLFQHVSKLLKYPLRDPFLSTSSDEEIGREFAGSGFVYVLDPSKITEKIWDVQAEYDGAGKTYPHKREKEFAVELMIPWEAVTGIQHKNKAGEWKRIKMPEDEAARSLNILASYIPGHSTMDWVFLDTDFGVKVDCRNDVLTPQRVDPWVTCDGCLTYPVGNWDITIDGEDCQYQNGGDETGKLVCPESGEIGCIDDPEENNIYACDGDFVRQPVFICAY